ncbi:ATP-dependent DNA helicase MER3 [Tritrichomonas musculus]|uniref:ATP-dependent DNA helicase MER3 n=1 Tax=Tritrichomonas musculus TaxID=1915356 RepID=A0ABR2HAT4_9EUKA
MINPKYISLFPLKHLSPFQKRCMKEINSSGKNAIITTPLAIGEQFIPEFAIIRLLQTGLTHLIFYVFNSPFRSLNSDYFYERYCSLDINVQRINKISDIESDINWDHKTSIFIINFFDLIGILQEANDYLLNQISLIAFENLSSLISSILYFELFILYAQKYKFQIIGNNYSFENRDKLCQVFEISNEYKEILTYKDNKNDIFQMISVNDLKVTPIDEIFINEVKKYLPNQKIVIFCNCKAQIQINIKLIETYFPSLMRCNMIENNDYQTFNPYYKTHLSKGLGILDSNNLDSNKKIWDLFSNGIIKVLIVLYPSYFQIIQNDDAEYFDISKYKIDIAFIRGHISWNNISFLTSDICCKAIIINDEKNIEIIRNYIQGNQQIKLPEESFLPRFILQLINKYKINTKQEIENTYNKCFNNSFSLDTAIDILKTNNFIQCISEQHDALSFEITELGKIAESHNIDYNDINIFLTCKPLKSFEDLLAFLCTQTSTVAKFIEIKDNDNQKLRLMLEDPKVPYKRSYIHCRFENQLINNNDCQVKNDNDMPKKLRDNESFTGGEKAYILILYNSFNKDGLSDPDLTSDLFLAKSKVTSLCSCFLAISDLRRSFFGMYSSRELQKRLKLGCLNCDSLALLTQLPGVGAVFGAKLLNAGIDTYQKILELTPQKLKDILKRTSTKLASLIRELPNYSCYYELKTDYNKCNEDSIGCDRLINILFTVSNKNGTARIEGNNDETKVTLICGKLDDDKVLYFEKLQELSKPIEISISILKEECIEGIEFRIIDSDYIGPDVSFKIKSKDIH